MQIEKKETFTHFISDENSFSEFYSNFLIEEKNYTSKNVVIQFSNNINISTEEFLLFLDISVQKNQNGTSFVVIYLDIDVDVFPDNFNIVPTLQEAEDVIDMENMERELGF